MARDCGGCRGEGAHWRWCPQVVGFAASQYGQMSEQAEDLGDRIGANDPVLANRAYALAGGLKRKAQWAAASFQQQSSTRRDGKTEGHGE